MYLKNVCAYIWVWAFTQTFTETHLSLQFPYQAEYDDWLLEWPPGRGQGLILLLPPLPLLSFYLQQNESKRLVTLLWVCEGNELHLVTDWTGHLKPGLPALKGSAIAKLISRGSVKGCLLFRKLKKKRQAWWKYVSIGVTHIIAGPLSGEHLCSKKKKGGDGSCESILCWWQAVGMRQKQQVKSLWSLYANN